MRHERPTSFLLSRGNTRSIDLLKVEHASPKSAALLSWSPCLMQLTSLKGPMGSPWTTATMMCNDRLGGTSASCYKHTIFIYSKHVHVTVHPCFSLLICMGKAFLKTGKADVASGK